MNQSLFAFLGTVLLSMAAMAQTQTITNLDDVRIGLGLDRIEVKAGARPVKVAILDKAFYNVKKEIGVSLPKSTVYIPGSIPAPEDFKSDHGVRMAQIVASLATEGLKHPKRLQLRLYNTFGYTNFRTAIDDCLKNKVDLILYSEVWEFGGNLDGRGFINVEVDRAAKAGILWINAAGNFGQTTFNGRIETLQEDWVRLPDDNRSLRLICKAPKDRKCLAKGVLSWSDFKDDAEEGTNKDLDVALTDDLLNILTAGSLQQSDDRQEARPGYSKYPRETFVAELNPGLYYIRVKNRSKNFDRSDWLRITVDGDNLEMPSAQPLESILVPADNPRVLTIGATDSERSGMSTRLRKPDLLAPSSVKLSDGSEFRGSSNAAAFVAGAAAVMRMGGFKLKRELFIQRGLDFNWERSGMPLSLLRFRPASGPCFTEGVWPEAPGYVKQVLAAGGRLVATSAGWRIMVPFDPIRLDPRLQRFAPDDMIAATPEGLRIFKRLGFVPPEAIEVFARPVEAGLCNRPSPLMGRLFSL